tara:strand:+ start:414 stop:569 length:156 start_codon:yes stop_codon:yes gene_type:complete
MQVFDIDSRLGILLAPVIEDANRSRMKIQWQIKVPCLFPVRSSRRPPACQE